MKDKSIVRTYLDSFFSPTPDFVKIRALLTDDFTFRGPLIEAASADEYVAKLQSLEAGHFKADIVSIINDFQQVAVLYDLITPFGKYPTVEWFWIKADKIAAIRLLNDPRPFLASFAT